MASETWLHSRPEVYQIITTLNELCEETMKDKLKDIADEFTWLDEIVDEAYKQFSVKSTRLEQMPKTPSLKNKTQKRTQPKVDTVVEEDSVQGRSPVLPKSVPTKLKFDLDSFPIQAPSDEASNSESGRPMRRCRAASKPVYVDDDQPPKRSTRQSRKPVESKSGETKGRGTKASANTEQGNKENHPPVANIAAIETAANVNESPGIEKIKKCTSNITQEKSEEKSPSVRERAKAYEYMLKHNTHKSPAMSSCSGTPGSSGRVTPASAKVDSLKKESNAVKCSPIHGQSGSSKSRLSRRSLHRQSRKSLQHRSSRSQGSSSKGSKKSSETSGSRPVRTRLRLKKQNQQQEQDMDTTEAEQATQSASQGESKRYVSEKQQVPSPGASQSSEETSEEHDVEMQDDCHDYEENAHQGNLSSRDILDETQTVVTEVYEITGKTQAARLKEFEVVKTKTTPVNELEKLKSRNAESKKSVGDNPCSSSDQGFNDDDGSGNESSNESVAVDKGGDVIMKEKTSEQAGAGRSTRTRTRAQQAKANKDSGVEPETTEQSNIANTTFTKDDTASPPAGARTTRTRARAQKESNANETSTDVMEGGTRTRTRQKKQEEAVNTETTKTLPEESGQPSVQPFRSTRSRMRKVNDPNNVLTVCGSDDEVIAGSPAMGTPRSSLRAGKKRLGDNERGLSPRPKRSCVGDHSSVSTHSPLSTSSPNKRTGLRTQMNDEERDTLLSPARSSKPYNFSTAQRKVSSSLNRTPVFGQNTSKFYSFLSATPTCRSNGVLSSFLKRNTPPPKQTVQVQQEQKKQKLLEKESREKERLRKANELRQRKIEEQKRIREERERKVAEAREMRLRFEQEQKEKINKKFEDKAILKEKLMKERTKEEREKQKLRLKKQMEADARRKQEEEERIKKILEQEEEARMQEEFMQRKKEFEDAERKRQIAEEKKKQEERLAALEQKHVHEKARLIQIEEEKERERERIRQEKERQMALERAERDRMEREKREEREKKLREDMEKLKALEKERIRKLEEEAEKQQRQEAQHKELLQMINKHNNSVSKQPSTVSVLNTTQTLTNSSTNSSSNNTSSYDMTPVKVKICGSKNKNPENYDIDDKGSDDSTDDDEAPKKRIPEWAMGISLNTALIRQHTHPPDLEEIFRISCIDPPDLTRLFPGKKRRRYNERTSSAIWTSPVMRH